MASGKTDKPPALWVIAGPNGAGKTTFAREFLPQAGILEFLNADAVAGGLSPLRPEASAYEASRLLLQRWDSLVKRRLSFAVESTLSGRTYARRLAKARRKGYLIHIAYLWLPQLSISLRRIRQRVKKGGHAVPEADARRRFPVSLLNFWDVYLSLADRAVLWNVSTNPPTRAIEWNTFQPAPIIYQPDHYEKLKKQIAKHRQEVRKRD